MIGNSSRVPSSLAFDLIEDCGRTYRYANDGIKRLMLQALFNKIWVDNEGVIGSEFTEIYKNIAGPIEKDIAQRNEKSASDNSDADFPDRLLKSYSKFFEKGLNNELLVEQPEINPNRKPLRFL